MQQADEIMARFGSLKLAFALVKRVTGGDDWDAIARSSTEDLLVYLSLGRFRRRPPMSAVSIGLQRDIRSFFGNDASAGRPADDRLFYFGDAETVHGACGRSFIGRPLHSTVYRHRSVLEPLDSLLRASEGCTRDYLGEVAGANLIHLSDPAGRLRVNPKTADFPKWVRRRSS